VQLDFQLPIRFNLKYRSDDEEVFKRPVIIHRAIYGSLERFVAVLVEHYAGKFPFWLSPRQILIVTVGAQFVDYGYKVKDQLFRAGFDVDIEDTGKTLNKKIREGQLAHYNFILVVGAQEQETNSVNIRTRDNKVHGTKTVEEAIAMFKHLEETKSAEE
jgi:threonyl-tRNA synthetase